MNSLLRATGYHELKSHFKESLIQGEKKLRVKIVMPLHQVDSFQVLTFSAGEKLVPIAGKNKIYYRLVDSFFQIQKLLEY